jgi:hypothetical protein
MREPPRRRRAAHGGVRPDPTLRLRDDCDPLDAIKHIRDETLEIEARQ